MEETAAQKRKTVDGDSGVKDPSSTKKGKADGDYETSDEFIKFLLNTKVEELRTPSGKIFVAYRNEAAPDVFRGLITQQVLSCPVLTQKGSFHFACVDMMNYVEYFVGQLKDKDTISMKEDFWSVMTKEVKFKEMKVKDLMVSPLSFRNTFHPLKPGFSLYTAVEALAIGTNVRRLPIVDENRKIVNLITQSQIVDLTLKNVRLLGKKKSKPIHLCSPMYRHVHSIVATQPAIEGFKIMIEKCCSGIAVVDEHGKLIGNISVKDLKAIDTDGKWFSRLFFPASKYIEELQKDFPHHKRPFHAITVHGSDTIETTLHKLVENKIHRVYIVDEHHKPVGVVSLRDVLKEIIA